MTGIPGRYGSVEHALDSREPPRIIRRSTTEHHTPRWRNWQTHYFEVVAGNTVQVQILSWASMRGDPNAGRLLLFPPGGRAGILPHRDLPLKRESNWPVHSDVGTDASNSSPMPKEYEHE